MEQNKFYTNICNMFFGFAKDEKDISVLKEIKLRKKFMMEEMLNNNLAKELLVVLMYCDSELTNKISNDFINNIKNMAAESKEEFYIDEDKDYVLEKWIINDNKEVI